MSLLQLRMDADATVTKNKHFFHTSPIRREVNLINKLRAAAEGTIIFKRAVRRIERNFLFLNMLGG
jgi:hypothetical protein